MKLIPRVSVLSIIVYSCLNLAEAATVTFDLNGVANELNQTPSDPSPWATITFNDIGYNQVQMSVTSNIVNTSEFYNMVSFNFDPSLNVEDLQFSNYSFEGEFLQPSITLSTNGIVASDRIRFDIGLNFDTSNQLGGSGRFNQTDSLSYLLTYNGGIINSNSFKFMDYSNQVEGGIHMMGIPIGDGKTTSSWIVPIPEPTSASLFGGIGLISLFRRRRS